MIAQKTDPLAIRKVLGHLGLRTESLELSRAGPPTQMRFVCSVTCRPRRGADRVIAGAVTRCESADRQR